MKSTLSITETNVNAKLLITLSGVLYGLLGYFGTSLMKADLSVSSMLFWRFSISALVILLFKIPREYSQFKLNTTLLLPIFIASALYGGAAAFYFMASEHLGTGSAMVVFFTYPAFVMILSWVFENNRISYLSAGCLLLIFIGMILLVKSNEWVFNLNGMILAIIAAFLYGLYIFTSKKDIHKVQPLTLTMSLCMGCSIIFFIICLMEGSFSSPQTYASFMDVLAISILCTVFPAFLMLKGLKTIDADTASILTVLEPVVTVVIGALVLGEMLTNTQLCGVFIILSGTILIQTKKTTQLLKK